MQSEDDVAPVSISGPERIIGERRGAVRMFSPEYHQFVAGPGWAMDGVTYAKRGGFELDTEVLGLLDDLSELLADHGELEMVTFRWAKD